MSGWANIYYCDTCKGLHTHVFRYDFQTQQLEILIIVPKYFTLVLLTLHISTVSSISGVSLLSQKQARLLPCKILKLGSLPRLPIASKTTTSETLFTMEKSVFNNEKAVLYQRFIVLFKLKLSGVKLICLDSDFTNSELHYFKHGLI